MRKYIPNSVAAGLNPLIKFRTPSLEVEQDLQLVSRLLRLFESLDLGLIVDLVLLAEYVPVGA